MESHLRERGMVRTEGTDYRTLYDRDYLGSFDLPSGRDVTVTISNVVGGDLIAIGGRKSKKPIISFEGKEKRFICNKTNAKAIANLYGNYVEAWKGKRITLFVSQTRDPSTGGDIDCLRVRPQAPSERKTADQDLEAQTAKDDL